MGYSHGRKWTEELIIKEIKEVIRSSNIARRKLCYILKHKTKTSYYHLVE